METGAPDRPASPGTAAWAIDRLTAAVGQSLDSVVTAAVEFAAKAHEGQTRRTRTGPPVPYFVHPVEVAVLAARWFGTVNGALPPLPTLLTAAILHDTIEDCAVPVDALDVQFGGAATELVLALTKPRLREDETAEERLGRFARQIAAAGPAAVFVKCCDLVHNLAELEATPTSVLRKAVHRGTTYYLPLLEQVPLGEPFRAVVRDALDCGAAAVASASAEAERTPLGRILARSGSGKTEAHDAVQFLQEIDGSGQALVVRYPRRGRPVIVASGLDLRVDSGRLEAVRTATREQGGTARLRPSLFRTLIDQTAGAFACLDGGVDGTDTAIIWFPAGDWADRGPAGTPPEIILRLMLSAVMRTSAELYRDLAIEAMGHGLQLDMRVAGGLGVERGQLGQLVRWRDTCKLVCREVKREFQTFLTRNRAQTPLWDRTRIEYRVKTCASILAKFRKGRVTRWVWPKFRSMEDIAGVRIVCPTQWHTDRLVSFVEEASGERPLIGPVRRFDREPTVQGYRGVHLVRLVSIAGERDQVPCEVQIRTLVQDAWSTLSHAVAYKTDRLTGPEHRTSLRALSAALEECDRSAAAIFGRAAEE